jgi:hypothetical protein
MKTIRNFFGHLSFIFRPKYWIMLGKYSKAADDKLLKLAETNDFEPINVFPGDDGVFTVKLGDSYYWVANFPYNFLVERSVSVDRVHEDIVVFNYNENKDTQPLPSRLTISRLYSKLVNDLAKHNLKHVV